MLRGVAWDHTRAMAPLHGLAQVWRDRFGDNAIEWETRSLISFAEEPLDKLSERYDLIIFDYPLSGEALRAGWLYDLTKLLPTSVLRARENETIGAAYKSFSWNGMQAALPIDAACHVSCWRSDLLEKVGVPVPKSWDEAITLAKETGKVALPLTRTAVWGVLIDFCANLGEPPMKTQSFAFDRELALDAWAKICPLSDNLRHMAV